MVKASKSNLNDSIFGAAVGEIRARSSSLRLQAEVVATVRLFSIFLMSAVSSSLLMKHARPRTVNNLRCALNAVNDALWTSCDSAAAAHLRNLTLR